MATITSTDGNDNLNGGSGADIINGGAGNDKISGGSGNDTLDGGSGNDIVNGDSGDDILVYRLSENSGSSDVYTGGSGIDTIRLMLTNDEWLEDSVQTQIGQYLQHLAAVTNAKTMEVSNGSASDFTFNFISVTGTKTTLTIQMTEKLDVWVNGEQIDFHRINITSGEQKGAVVEDAVSAANSTIFFTDVDLAQNHTATAAAAAGNTTTLGTFTTVPVIEGANAANGSVGWTYTLDNAKAQYLAAGQTVTETYTVTVRDDAGQSTTQNVVITITGTNDAPTVAAALTAAADEDDASFTVDLLEGAADADDNAVLTVQNVTGLVAGVTVAGNTLTVNPADAAFQHLAAGVEQVITVSYDVVDEHGAKVAQSATITITGTNDVPTVAAALTAAADEDDASFTVDLLEGAADADDNAVLTVQNVTGLVAGVTVAGNTLTVNPADAAFQHLAAGVEQVITVSYDVVDEHGAKVAQSATITVTGTNDVPTVAAALTAAADEDDASITVDLLEGAADADDNAVLTVQNVTGLVAGVTVAGNTLTVNPADAAFQHLAAGVEQVITVSYDVVDEHGAKVAQSATITVTGTNDVPTVAAALTAAADEDDASITVDLLAGAADVDDNAVLTVQNVTGLVAGVTVAGNTLTVNPADAAFQHLAAGATQEITVSYDVVDEKGAKVAQSATITITGTNDVPTVAAALTAAADEDDASFTVDLLEGAADADDNAVLTVQNVTGLVAGVTVAGNTLTVNPADAAFQHLAAGVEQQITVTYEVADEKGAKVAQSATITITGTNDVPTVAAALTAAADEDDASFTVDLLEGAADADDNAVLTVQNVTGLVAGVTVAGNTLTVNPADAAFQHLAAGVEQVITVSYDVVDEHGAKVAQSATITITGTNDVPTVAAALTAAADEDDASFTVDLLEGAADADDNAVLTVQNVTGLVAGVTVAGNTLTVNPADAAFQHLAAGVEQVITVSYDVVDEHGAKVAQSATITVTGTNDVPTVAAALTAAADEDDASITVDLLAGAADVDDNAVLTVQNVTGLVAGVTVAGNTLTVNPADAAFQHLAAGATQEITVSYDVVDEKGAKVAQSATITITGTNDVPTVAAALTAAADEDDASFTVDLLEGAADADDNAVLTVQNVTGLVAGVTVAGNTLTVNPADAAFQHLAAGVEQQITVTYEVADEKGAKVAQSATITVTGTNDVPTVAAALTAAADEDDASITVDLLAGAADVDDNAVLTVQNVTGLVAGVTVAGNTLTVNPADAAFQHLAAGVEQVITVSYDVVDEKGAKVAQSATITITGTNDVPTVAAALTAAADEDDASITVDLLAGAADVDDNAVLTVQNVTGLVAGVTVAGNTLTVNPADAAFQHLAAGVEQVITVSYDVVDEHGAKVAQSATITVTGTNDVPTVAAALTAAADEDDASFTVDLLEGAADADDNAVLTVQNVTGLVAGVTVAGNTLTVNPADAAFQHLAAGVEQVITVSYDVVDEHGAKVAQSATITITGTNDVPTVAAALTAAADEDDASFTVDLLEGAADADDNAVLTVQNVTGLVAGVTVAGNTLTVNPADAAFQHLAAGATQEITVSYDVVDEKGAKVAQSATITITGTNDVPTVAAALTAAADEDDASFTVDLLEGAADADDNAVLTVQNVTGLVAGVTVAGNTLTVNPADAAFQHLAAGVEQVITVSYDVVDEHGAKVAQSATITVTGTNDVPTVAAALTAAADEDDASFTVDLLEGAADADDNAVLTVQNVTGLVAGVTVAGNTLTVNPADAAFQHLAAGVEQVITVSYDVVDEHGAKVAQSATITITGTNDVPTVAAALTAAADEDDASITVDLLAGAADVDDNAVLTVQNVTGLVAGVTVAGNTLTVNPADAAFQHLAAGVEQVITVSYDVVDEKGAKVAQSATITITGTNDVPTVAAALTAAADEDDASITVDLLAGAADVDDNAVLTVQNVTGLVAGVTVAGNTLTVNPADAAFQHLAAGVEQVITVSYDVVDEHGAKVAQSATITVTGTNDVPTVAAALTAAADEDDASFTVDLLEGAADADDNAVLTVQNVTGLVAGVTVAGNTLTVNPADAAFQHLAAGVEQVITVSYDVVDEHGAKVAQSATITITGTNDVPTVAAALTAAADEDDASFTVDLLEGAADADDNAVLTVQNVTGLVAGVTVAGNTLTVNPADAAFQHLAAGATQEITVSYDVVDEKGAKVAQSATITITGTNDVPTVAAALTAAADEDDASFTVDLLEGAADADDNAVLTVQNVTGLVAGVTVAGNTLTVNPADAAFQHLAAGVEQVITVSYDVVDEHGAKVAQSATITVTGTNDVPTVAAALTAAADEDDASFTVDLLEGAADADDNAVLTVQNVTGLVAGVTVAGNTLTVNPADAAFQHLAAGVEQQITVTYEVADEKGAKVAQSATITVTGTNDVPTVAAALTAAADEDDASITVDLLAGAADADDNAVLTVQNVTGLVAGVTVAGNTLTVNPADAAFQHLAAGATQEITVSYDVVDEKGAKVAQSATITITGTNDVPTVAAALTAAADEDDASFTVDLLEGAADADDNAVLTVQNVTGLVAGVTVAGNTLTVNPADAAFQHLAAGVEQVITVSYDVVDEHGAKVAQSATITVTGTNDVPTVAAALTAAADEDDASFTVDLLEGAADADDNAVLTVQNVTGLVAGVTVAGNTLTVNPADAAFQHLAAGVEQQITVTYEVADEKGAKVAQSATITVTGTNDVPTVAAALTAAADEDDASITVDLLAGAADADDNAVLTVQNVTGLVAGVTVAGNTLTVNPADAAFQHLAAGATQEITVSYDVVDEHGAKVAQSATITITGTNDVPTVAAALTAAADEDDASITVDLLEGAADADDNAVLTVQNVTGLVAGVTVAGNTLTVNPADAAFQHLAAGATQEITVSYDVVDEHGAKVAQSATITITGTNDVPTVAAALTAAADEDDASITVDLLEGAADADDNAVLTVQNVTGLVAGVTVAGNTLTVNPADAAFQHLAAGVEQVITVSYDVVDEHGAKVAQSATITITGTNDVPTVAAALTAAADEDDASITVDLLEGAADADDNAVLTVQNVTGLVAGVTVAGNTLTVNPADAAFQHLAAGATQEITVSYDVVDEKGAKVAQSATITITIAGTNDGPVAVADVASGTENQAVTIDVLANDTDADDGHAFTLLSGSAPTGKGTVGVADGKLVFNPGTAFDHLAAGVTEVVTLNYTMKDDQNAQSSSTVTVTITGTNDTPVIGGVSTGMVQEDVGVVANKLVTSGTLTISDADDNQSSFSAQGSTSGLYGTFSLATNGAWSYSGDNTLAAIQGLNAGQFLTDTFTAVSVDGTKIQSVVITINGSDEAPTNAGNTTYSFAADVTGVQTIFDQSGTDLISITGNNALLTSLNFERVGNDLVMQFNSQQVTVTNQYGSSGTNTIEAIQFASGQTYFGYQLQGNYTLVTSQNPSSSNANANWVLAGSSEADVLTGGSNSNQKDLIFGNGSGDNLSGRSGSDLLSGGVGNDILNGGDGNDVLVAGAGNDTITGGLGNDTFVFNTALSATSNVDHIIDFNANATDVLWLSKAIFSSLATQGSLAGTTLSSGDFVSVSGGGATAEMDGAHILYDANTGSLYYDPNGGNQGGRVEFAVLDNLPSNFDFNDIKVGS